MPLYNPGSSGGGSGTVTSVAAGDTSVVVGGTPTAAPTLTTGTLDAIAANHPPAAAVGMNSQKVTGLANGSGAQDAAAFGQLPVLSAADSSVAVAGTSAAPVVASVAAQYAQRTFTV